MQKIPHCTESPKRLQYSTRIKRPVTQVKEFLKLPMQPPYGQIVIEQAKSKNKQANGAKGTGQAKQQEKPKPHKECKDLAEASQAVALVQRIPHCTESATRIKYKDTYVKEFPKLPKQKKCKNKGDQRSKRCKRNRQSKARRETHATKWYLHVPDLLPT